jgi:hypothetical protein
MNTNEQLGRKTRYHALERGRRPSLWLTQQQRQWRQIIAVTAVSLSFPKAGNGIVQGR